MTSRKQRLQKLVKVQEQLKALHETRHAGYLASATAADREASELVERFDADRSLSALFPEIYHGRIGKALARRDQNAALARTEAGKLAAATARANIVEKAYREARRSHDRDSADRERLDIIERNAGQDDR